jgi:LuxR family maltose regulon positive regulatory protein
MPVLLALASVARRTGSPDFEAHMQVINAVVETGLSPLVSLITDVVVAELLLERGDAAGAEQWTRAGSACLATWPDAGILRERLQRLRERLEERRLTEPLTPAERRVLELLPTQLSQREIAERLFVSRETVRTHARDIYRKLEVHSRTEAVARAREVGLLDAH